MVNFNKQLILASNSPRRKQILLDAGFEVRVVANQVNEDYPQDLPLSGVAKYLAEKKAAQFTELAAGDVLITADTIVKTENEILDKPKDFEEGLHVIRQLSGRSHQVITGVCIRSVELTKSFDCTTTVHFRPIREEEIHYYLNTYFPYDKAGGYGIQEWLGMVAIERIDGSYFNVVGLPVHQVYETLTRFFSD